MTRNKIRFAAAFVAGALLATSLLPSAAPAAQAAGSLGGKRFGEPVSVSVPITRVSINDAVFGMEDGKETAYTTVTSENAIFNVIDVRSNTLLRAIELTGMHTTWRHAIAPDGTVYIAGTTSGNTPVLWSYSPVTKQATNHGDPAPGEKSLWAMTTDERGNVYGGTFQSGKVFKFDPVAKTFRDYGSMVAGQEYVRSMAYYEGHVYAGIGTTGAVVKLNVDTGEKTVISDPVAGILGVAPADVPFAYDMAEVDGYLLVRFAGNVNELLIYDLANETWLPHRIGRQLGGAVFGWNELESRDGKLYLIVNRQLAEIDLTTFQARSTGISFGSSLRGAEWIAFPDDPQLPGESIVTMTSDGKTVVMNPATGVRKERPSVVAGAPNPLHQLEPGPDGKLYMSGYPGGLGAVYDPVTDSKVNFSIGQAEGIVALGDYMYYGVYPGGLMYRSKIGPGAPVAQQLFTIGSDQDRPYMMTTGAGKLMIGTIPTYGKLGGALTIYDPATGEKKVYANVIHNQSITGLVYRDGLIYGGSNIYGGLGVTPTETEAKLFVWDVAAEKKVAEFTLDIPELDKPPMITGLTIGPDGMVWGNADGVVFKMDPSTYEIVDYKNIYPDVKNYGFWRPYHPRWGEDGLLYVDLADRMTVVDPETMDFVQLTPNGQEINFMAIAADASGIEQIYYTAGAHLMKIPVANDGGGPTDPVERDIPVTNGGFETTGGGTIPGWTNPYPNGLAFGVTDEKSRSGARSAKIADASREASGGLLSDPIAVKSGKTYTASVNINMTEGDPDDAALMLYFYDAAGKELGYAFSLLGSDVPNQWHNVEVTGVAPAEAAQARIMLYSSRWNVITAYYDDVTLRSPDDLGDADGAPGKLALALNDSAGTKTRPVTLDVVAEETDRLYAAKLSLAFDPASFTLESVVEGEALANGGGYLTWKQDGGKATVVATKVGDGEIGDGDVVASLTFRPTGKTGASSFALLGGESTLARDDAETTGALFALGSDVVAAYEVVERLEDVTGDGKVAMDDLVAVARRIGAPAAEHRSLDVNRDGVIDIADLALVAAALLDS
ncbi:dockerin type I domain-containing protein [Paenibacillus sp.]|uniref:dockerin type I domain-containing protein n=1 Tax=Paenibacillus sp. TaxID=58172 RepID=UPI0028127CFD|nr:dockerin type I domain-containing protein [Paenibacillus sp.]